jgi:glycosyltransferase involved in cell wall biosynthesis
MMLYRLSRRTVVLTAHNVNIAARDGNDNWLNHATLRCQYWLAQHIFVHSERMKVELRDEFGVDPRKVTVIPFGLNTEVPTTKLGRAAARERLGLDAGDRVALVFGQISTYKGIEYLVRALPEISRSVPRFRALIAGRVNKGHEGYWQSLQGELSPYLAEGTVLCRIEHIPDGEVEVFFKAADVVVLPYVRIFQSGVPFLAYSFGVPVIATDAGSLAEVVIDGVTGYVCAKEDANALAVAIRHFFAGELYKSLPEAMDRIRVLARERYSWARVAELTESVYLTGRG